MGPTVDEVTGTRILATPAFILSIILILK